MIVEDLIEMYLDGSSSKEVLDYLCYKGIFESTKFISKTVEKSWLKRALKKDNYEGPNGNEVIAYVWKWKWDIKDTGDEVVDVRVSDWDEAELCQTCKRKIVHVFFVHNKEDDTVKPFGFDHVHTILGIDRELSKSLINKIKNNVSIPKDQKDLSTVDLKRIKRVLNLYSKTASSTIKGAADNLDKVFGYLLQPKNISNNPLFFNEDDKKYVFLVGSSITPATIKRVEKLLPAFKKVPESKVYAGYMKFKYDEYIKDLARDTVKDALFDYKDRMPMIQRSRNYLWAANFKQGKIMVAPALFDGDDIFKDHYKDWELGNEELAKKFREKFQK